MSLLYLLPMLLLYTNLPPATSRIQPVRLNGMTQYTEQCSGDDSSPSSPGEGLAPWDATDTNVQRVALRPMAADCRRYSGVYHVLGGTIHPHRFNIQRGGRQVAAPTVMYNVFRIL